MKTREYNDIDLYGTVETDQEILEKVQDRTIQIMVAQKREGLPVDHIDYWQDSARSARWQYGYNCFNGKYDWLIDQIDDWLKNLLPARFFS